MRFFEKFEENVRLYPDKVILRDSESTLTFRELDELSGRIYAYLKQKGIRKEDFVMINMPRSIKCCATLVGAIKAAVACVPIAENTPEARKEYIRKDCNAILEINPTIWEDIKRTPPLPGFENRNIHDAAFAAYTSGSEGTPKGILMESGCWNLFVGGFHRGENSVFKFDDTAALAFPLQGTLYAIGLINSLYTGSCFSLLDPALLATPRTFEAYLIQNRITVTCLPCSILEQSHIKSPYLRLVILSTEVANAVGEHDFDIVNLYGQTEGPTVCMHFFRGPLENVPIGLPTDADVHPIVLDDNDEPITDGRLGEICYENPFTRGYINSPELNQIAFRNGLFHTGDIARVNEDGNYVILGRKTDMIKINGNRIEPAEIEAAVKRVLGIDWAFAKGFVQPERSFICVYYTADIEIDYAETREALLEILPNYMIPSYFIHIDSIPRLPNGKVDRKAFQAPNLDGYFTEYIAPTNELEERLCETMQEVLGIERLGINDDFYLLGGDSLRTIKLVSMLDIQGISVPDIYEARTPAAIAERWLMKQLEN